MNIYDVFISYRRSDGLMIAESLYKYLTSKGLRVFLDKNKMIDGHYFTTQIESNLHIAPNYVLVATDDVFKFRKDEDWVRTEIEISVKDYESDSAERTITVIAPENVRFPDKKEMSDNIRDIADAQRIILPCDGEYTEQFYRVLKAVTCVNRRNMWYAAHRWLVRSKNPGGRFATLNINENILPNANKVDSKHIDLPINVYTKSLKKKEAIISKSLFDAVSSEKAHLYLIGQGGIGKTTALMHIMNLAYLDKCYTGNSQIPIFVELSFAPDTFGALYENGKSSFIRRSIYKQIRTDRTIKQVEDAEIEEIEEVFTLPKEIAVNPINDILSKTTPAPEYLLLLDGLNEVSTVTIKETGLSVAQMVVREIEMLMSECHNVRIILTSRSDDVAITNESTTRFYLSGINDTTIRKYMKDVNVSSDNIEKAILDEQLLEVLRIPLFLILYASLSDKNEVNSRGEILRLFFNERRRNLDFYTVQNRLVKVERDTVDSGSTLQNQRIDADMQNFILDFIIPEIAWNLEQKREFYLRTREIRRIIELILVDTSDISVCGAFGREVFAKYRNGSSASMHTYSVAKKIVERMGNDLNEVAESIINCCVFVLGILHESNGKYGFAHQHIRDYFAAVKNINTIRLSVYLYEEGEKKLAIECMNKVFCDKPVNHNVRILIGEYLGEHRNEPYYVDGKLHYGLNTEKCDRNLINRVLDVYRGGFNGEFGYGIYSLITVLKEVRKDLSGSDFSNLDVSLCDFNGSILGNKDFGADFRGSKISASGLFPQNHGYKIWSAKYSPDGNYILTASEEGGVKLWRSDTLTCVRTVCKGKLESAVGKNIAVFSIDGKYIVTGSFNGLLRIYDTKDFKCIKEWHLHGAIEHITFNPNCDLMAITTASILYPTEWNTIIFRLTNFTIKSTLPNVGRMTFSKDGKYLVSAFDKFSTDYGEIMFALKKWDIKEMNCAKDMFISNEPKEAYYYSERYEMALYGRGGKTIITTSLSGNIRIWDAETFNCIRVLEGHTNWIISADISFDSNYLVTYSLDKSIRVWSLKDFSCVWVYNVQDKNINMVSFACNKNFIVFTYDYDGVEICDVVSMTKVGEIAAKKSGVNDIQFSPDGLTLLIASEDNAVRIMSTKTGKCIETLHNFDEEVIGARFDHKGTKILTTTLRGVSSLWNAKTYQFERQISQISSEEKYNVFPACFSPDDTAIIAQAGKYLSLFYETANYKPIIKLGKWNTIISYSADGCYIAISGMFAFGIYDTQNWSEIFVKEFEFAISDIAVYGNKVYVAVKDNVEIYNIKTKEKIGVIYGNWWDSIKHVCLNKNGTLVVTTGVSTKIWNADTLDNTNTIEIGTKAVFNPENTRLATMSGTRVDIWDTETYKNIYNFRNISGLVVHQAIFTNLHPDSEFTQEDKAILEQYGAIVG